MAAAVLLRSVTRKMSRAAAPPHHRSLIARGLHGGARSGPANSNQVQVKVRQGATELVSAGMAAASGLRSGAGRLTTKVAHAPPPPHHRLVHGRRVHNRTSPDPSPSTPKKVLDTSSTLDMVSTVAVGVGCIAVFSSAIYMHFCVSPARKELKATFEDLRKKSSSQKMGAPSVSHQTRTTAASGQGKD